MVFAFGRSSELQPPERTILDTIGPRLGDMDVLDLGVGAGRTARHLLGRVGRYTGVDLSPRMVAACRKRFPQHRDAFQVADARALTAFGDQAFDLVLFSYNGIDYVEHADRLKTLAEVRRVGKAGGLFCFSSHNLRSFHWRWSWKQMTLIARLAVLNGRSVVEKARTLDHMMIRDQLWTISYHVAPQAQVRQLVEAGFSQVRAFGRDGRELQTPELETARDPWVYFLCVI